MRVRLRGMTAFCMLLSSVPPGVASFAQGRAAAGVAGEHLFCSESP